MSIAFTPDKIIDAKKDFVGVIVVSEYLDNVRFTGKQLHIEIATEEYDKNQHELFQADFIPLGEYEKGAIAFAIDGEGSISLCKVFDKRRGYYYYVPRVTVVNNCRYFLEVIRCICGGGSVYPRKKGGWAVHKSFEYDMNRIVMRNILPQIQLVIKEAQRDLLLDALEILETVPSRLSDVEWKTLEEIHVLMGTLNSGDDLEMCKWFAPSDKRLTKWAHFIEALSKCGALKEVNWEGLTPEEQMQNFAKSLKGMKCRFVEFSNLPSIAKNKEKGTFTQEVILPTEYHGKVEIGEVKEETLAENKEVTL